MKIAVVGMGLIGGSFCRAIKAKTAHKVYGWNRSRSVIREAFAEEAIDGEIRELSELRDFDLVILGFHPELTLSFAKEHLDCFPESGLTVDTCGVKESIVSELQPLFDGAGRPFIGTHPMAGREFSGFQYSLASLYEGASWIVTPPADVNPAHMALLRRLARELGFSRLVETDPRTHDATIAYTSQVAHVLSNAYVKSPTLKNESGFSAGSFKDLSRVAKLNAGMWTELFMMNREALSFEIETLIENLKNYDAALRAGDREELFRLLKEGNDLKEWSIDREARLRPEK